MVSRAARAGVIPGGETGDVAIPAPKPGTARAGAHRASGSIPRLRGHAGAGGHVHPPGVMNTGPATADPARNGQCRVPAARISDTTNWRASMASLTVWKFGTPYGADAAMERLQMLQSQQLITVQDAAMVSWEEGKKKPKTRQLHDTKKGGALGGGLLGPAVRPDLLHPDPRPGDRRRHRRAVRLAGRRRHQRLVHQDRARPGHPGHLGAVPAQLGRGDRPGRSEFPDTDAELISTNLSADQEAKLREAFAE